LGHAVAAHQFLKPPTSAETLAAFRNADGDVKVIGGGTDVVYNMRDRLFRPDVLLSIRDLRPSTDRASTDGKKRAATGAAPEPRHSDPGERA